MIATGVSRAKDYHVLGGTDAALCTVLVAFSSNVCFGAKGRSPQSPDSAVSSEQSSCALQHVKYSVHEQNENTRNGNTHRGSGRC